MGSAYFHRMNGWTLTAFVSTFNCLKLLDFVQATTLEDTSKKAIFKQGDCILDIVVHLFCHNFCNFLWNQSCPIIKMEYLQFFILAFIAVESTLWSRHCWHTLFHRNKKNPVFEFFSFSTSHNFGCLFFVFKNCTTCVL